MRAQVALPVVQPSDVAEARRAAASLLQHGCFDETASGKIALVVTEAGTNLIKHANGGTILLRQLEQDDIAGLEIVAIDSGPGHADVERCLEDGYSTAGSCGTGLGAIRRLATEFDIYSLPGSATEPVPGQGTALRAEVWASPPVIPSEGFVTAAISMPKSGQQICGDAWACELSPARGVFLVADGLGHGPFAFDAARQGVRALLEHPGARPAEIVEFAHGFMRGSRGACIGVAEVLLEQKKVRFCGVGNIAASLLSPGKHRHMASMNGTAGQGIIKCSEFQYDWTDQDVLIMHSDGLSARWRAERYEMLTNHHPSLMAAVLYRDNTRKNDDATVLAARLRR